MTSYNHVVIENISVVTYSNKWDEEVSRTNSSHKGNGYDNKNIVDEKNASVGKETGPNAGECVRDKTAVAMTATNENKTSPAVDDEKEMSVTNDENNATGESVNQEPSSGVNDETTVDETAANINVGYDLEKYSDDDGNPPNNKNLDSGDNKELTSDSDNHDGRDTKFSNETKVAMTTDIENGVTLHDAKEVSITDIAQ